MYNKTKYFNRGVFALANIISFGIVGGASFRAQYFLRIARALPERFRVCGMVVRNEEKGTALQEAWGVPTFRTIDEMLARERPLFVVVSVGVQYCADIILQLAQARIPVLSETPPAADLNQLTALYEQIVVLGAKVQVAEQYHLHPMHSARIGMIQSGWLGKVSQVTVSISHMYHAVSLMRKYLDVKFENATIRAMRFTHPLFSVLRVKARQLKIKSFQARAILRGFNLGINWRCMTSNRINIVRGFAPIT